MSNLQKDLEDSSFRDILVYLARTDSLIKFINSKIIDLNGKLFSSLETREIIEAFVIKIICDWEWFIERYVTHSLAKDTSKLAEYLNLSLPAQISYDEGVAILNSTGYFDFKNCTDIKSIAKKILANQNNAIQAIEKEVAKCIDSLYVMRNYIAHKSNKSKKSLISLYNQLEVTEFIEPGIYLLNKSKNEEFPDYTNFYHYVLAFFTSVFQIWEHLFPDSFEELKENGEFNQNSMLKLLSLLRFREAEL